MYKYPRTPHIEGSRLQPGDEDLDSVPFSAICAKHSAEGIASQYVAVEEKVDGANSVAKPGTLFNWRRARKAL